MNVSVREKSLFFTFPFLHRAVFPLYEGSPSVSDTRLSLWVISPVACRFSGALVRKRPLERMEVRWTFRSWCLRIALKQHADVLPSGLPPLGRDVVTWCASRMHYDAMSIYFWSISRRGWQRQWQLGKTCRRLRRVSRDWVFFFFLVPRYRRNCSWIFAILLERYIFYKDTSQSLD